MEFRRAAVSFFLRSAISIICKVDCREFVSSLSKNKPLLVIFNHINFLEVPILVAYSYPLRVTGLVKIETWKNPFFAFLFNTYKAVPIDRSGMFQEAFKHVRESIDNGFYMCVAPEGTRSKNGVLGRGKAGIIQLALDANVPILPVAHHGGENVWKNMKRFRRTPLYFSAGRPFRIKFDGRPGKEEREEILTEVMGQMARLLPEQMRGIYTQHTERECKYLDFI
jgi:1-acyl-sn-glycerol-3-phosphate acyltransferase